jgi:hypothetical protein
MLNERNVIISRKQSIHALFNQLTIVIGRADLLSVQTEEHVRQAASLIKTAGLRIKVLVEQLNEQQE